MSIIRRFSFVVLSLTRHSYKEYESVQTTSGISGIPSRSVTILNVVAIAMPIAVVDYIALDCEGISVYRLVNKYENKTEL
ncbi:hypothetical protein PTT_17595 [Pyrenophora teres f. teres 0-1]|uniref:Uncharacterized protein n=1 Tax=Pyrenophora teres f. teres (strain 0-1) TaxID=861557 RepID=E3S4R8_PYRTT|nr:hypothetical protein PTT_17595 [Pyrenophora teres f. teres 0-1]